MKASILIVGHPFPHEVEFGADHAVNYDESLEILAETKYAVLVVADRLPQRKSDTLTNSLDLLKAARKLNDDMQTILVSSAVSPQDLQIAINEIGLFKTVFDFKDGTLQQAVREALEEYELIKQNQAFMALTQEQNARLQHLSVLLEEKVRARENFLVEAREKLLTATKRTESLNRALVAIQKSLTKQDIEKLLTDALQLALGLSWTRILFKHESFIENIDEREKTNITIFSSPLFRDTELLGHIYFARNKDNPFTSDEDDFLLQVGDAVALAIDRLMALDAIESLKQEWDSTFDSITGPVSLVDENYQLLRVNKSYADRSVTTLEDLSGQKCFESLFNRKSPCEGCKLGAGFDLGEMTCKDGTPGHFAVTSHRVQLDDGKNAYAMFYRDVSQEQRIQRQILESSKMAEIGTIGSSIAHEINNPLGGIIAFVQILKGELTKEDKIYSDVVEMEKAALRCKTIVENLLAFTRQSISSELQTKTINEIVRLATNIIELQTRGLGIQIEKKLVNPDIKIKADTNQLVQVLVNVMQNSCESLAERMSSGNRGNQPKITIESQIMDEEKTLVLKITDNGTGIPAQDLARVFTPFFTTKEKSKNPGLGLSVSYQIVKDHGGQMEISSVHGQTTTVVITLPVAKSPTHEQIFDKGF